MSEIPNPDQQLQLLRTRRSVRRFKSTPVKPDLIAKVIQAASWAPSAHNRQPWRFIVLYERRHRDHLIQEMAKSYRKDLLADGMSEAEISRRLEESRRQLDAPPLLILCGLDMSDMDQYPDDPRQGAEHLLGVQSVAAAIQNILLAASACGLGTCWNCSPLFCQDAVRRALVLPQSFEAQAILLIGYPAETPEAPPRSPIENWMQYSRRGGQ